MSKNKSKTNFTPPRDNKKITDNSKDEMLKMQTGIAKLQESLNCLFGYLVRKNIINADEFQVYLINEFKAHSEERIARNANLQGAVSMTYYHKESMEVIQ